MKNALCHLSVKAVRILGFALFVLISPLVAAQTSEDTRLVNISTLGFLSDDTLLSAGFIVQGPTPRRIVVLAERFQSDLDAGLLVTDLSNEIVYGANDDWQDDPTAAEVESILGRAPGHPLDAAFAVTLEQGVYVAHMVSIDGRGQGIVAINDFTSAPGGTRMINLSTLGFINNQPNNDGLAAGFIVIGPEPRRFILLGERFKSNLDPVLGLFKLDPENNFDLVAFNDDWVTDTNAKQIQALLGRTPGMALDSALMATLDEGVYVAALIGFDDSTGAGIVAINDVNERAEMFLDRDGDDVDDRQDNCPDLANPDQQDSDNDGIGNACDAPDFDNDGFDDSFDNCPEIPNPDQQDSNNNGIGDICEDKDGDGVENTNDNCPSNANADQRDEDGDGVGDACDRNNNSGGGKSFMIPQSAN